MNTTHGTATNTKVRKRGLANIMMLDKMNGNSKGLPSQGLPSRLRGAKIGFMVVPREAWEAAKGWPVFSLLREDLQWRARHISKNCRLQILGSKDTLSG